MLKLSQNTLDKLNEMLSEAGYLVRNEKGNFKSGHCLIESTKTIVLNKFSTVETKVAYLLEIIHNLPIDENSLEEKNRKLLLEIRQMQIPEDSARLPE